MIWVVLVSGVVLISGSSVGVTATPIGMLPTFTEAVTVFVAVSIIETLPLPKFVTYTFVPSGETTTPRGKFPTSTVAVTALVAVSITETVPISRA